jgi:hypothetical protein
MSNFRGRAILTCESGSASRTRRLSARSASTVPRGLGSSIGMIAVIWPASKKRRIESSIAQTTTANGALSPGRREALPHALDASFAALKNPRFQARGFFSSRGLPPAYAGNVLSDASQEAANRAALFLLRRPSHSHGTFDDVSLNPVASWAAKRSQVVAQRARLNRRQLHWRTASRALRALV